MRLRIRGTDTVDQRQRETRRGVHRQKEGDESRFADGVAGQRRSRRVDAVDLGPGSAQPRRRRRKPEWLPPKIVRTDKKNFRQSRTPDLIPDPVPWSRSLSSV